MTLHRFVFVVALVVAVGFTGCSRQSRLEEQLAKGQKHLAAGDYDKAEVAYRNALQLDPANGDAIAHLGILFADEGRILQSGPLLLRAKELQPDNIDVRHRLAVAQLSVKYLDGVREEASKVLELDPMHAEAPILLVESATSAEGVEAVRKQLQALPTPAREGAAVVTALAILDIKQGYIDEATAALEGVVSRDSSYAPAFAALGRIHAAKGNAEAATAALKKAADVSQPRSLRRVQYAQWLTRRGDVAGAKAYMEALTKEAPDYLPAWLLLANMAAAEHDYDAARKHLNRVFSRDANNPEALLLSGQIQLANGEAQQAVEAFERALKLFPSSPQFLHQLAIGHAAAGDNTKALGTLSQALALAPDFLDASLLQARLLVRTGDMGGAIVTLRQVIEKQPQVLVAWTMLAEAYRSQNNLNGALDVYDELERRFPGQPQTPLLRGQILLGQNRFDEARAAFHLSWKRAPDSIAPLEHLVDADVLERKFDAALELIAEVSKKKPDTAELHLLRARVLLAAERAPEAEADLHRAIELAPDSPAGYSMLAALYFTTDRSKEALQNFTKVVERNPRDVPARMMIGMLKQDQQQYAEALAAFEAVLEVDPRSAVALNNAAYLYSEEFNDLDKAFAAARKAREIQPHEPHMADTLGWVVYQRGQYPWALSLLQEAADKLPSLTEAHYHLGVVQYMMGIEDGAKASFQRALSLDPDFEGADDARARLSLLQIDPANAGDADRSRLEQVLQERPTDPVALVRLGALHERSDGFAKAAELYRAALKANPENVHAMVRLMQAYLQQDEPAKAIELGRDARKLAPDDSRVTLALGRAAFASRDYRWAHSLLQEVARKLPNDADVLHAFGWSAYSVGQPSDAVQALRKALDLDSDAAWAAETRSALQLMEFSESPERAGTAAEEIERALENGKPSVPALMASAALEEFRSQPGSAIRAYESVLSAYPEFAPAKRRLVLLLAESRQDDARAVALVNDARAAYRNDAELAKAAGVVLFRTKDFSRALPFLREAVAVLPSDAAAWFYLGMTQRELKDSAAAESLAKAIELGLSSDLATEAQAALKS